MRTIQTVAALRSLLRSKSTKSGSGDFSRALVPTLGALHEGHLSLIRRAIAECDQVVVSLFVNPLQFGPQEDFSAYPRTLAADEVLCREAGVDVLFVPSPAELFARGEITKVVPPPSLVKHLCGPWRPGHFEGVLTIVSKLLHLVQPQRAYFGQKDAQQLALIQRMVTDLNLPVTVVDCPTVREADGLALSSRNQYLTAAERAIATQIYQGLRAAQQAFQQGDRQGATLLSKAQATYDQWPDLKVQYLTLVQPETLQPIDEVTEAGLLAVAAYVGQTRLIDNVPLKVRVPMIAIDGPAGAGKSTVARQVAAQLGLLYLDTGALYRALTWLAIAQGVAVTDEPGLAELAATMTIRLEPPANPSEPTRVWVNGQEVTQVIRSQAVTSQVSTVAAQGAVREALLRVQKEMGKVGGVVIEGRDIGTQVFPEAELKIFLTATSQARAQRRHREMVAVGETIDISQLVQQIEARDRQDRERPVAPLRQADDAIVIETDHLTQAEVCQHIIDLYRQQTLKE